MWIVDSFKIIKIKCQINLNLILLICKIFRIKKKIQLNFCYLKHWYIEYNGYVKGIIKSQPLIFEYLTLHILNNRISRSFSKSHLVWDYAVWLYIHQIATHQWKSSWRHWPVSLPRPSEPYQIPANQWLQSSSCPPERKKLVHKSTLKKMHTLIKNWRSVPSQLISESWDHLMCVQLLYTFPIDNFFINCWSDDFDCTREK